MNNPYVGEVTCFGFKYVPVGWIPCRGQMVSIDQHKQLYSVLRTTFGGVNVTSLDEAKGVTLNSVNGSIVLIVPSGANAQVRASTVHGAITNDFGLTVNEGQYVGRDLTGQIGSGGPRIRLNNVNGSIAIKRGERSTL